MKLQFGDDGQQIGLFGTRDGQGGAVRHDEAAAVGTHDFLHMLEVDEVGVVHAKERRVVQQLLKLAEGLGEEHRLGLALEEDGDIAAVGFTIYLTSPAILYTTA